MRCPPGVEGRWECWWNYCFGGVVGLVAVGVVVGVVGVGAVVVDFDCEFCCC